MKVKELIEWLTTQDQEASVEILVGFYDGFSIYYRDEFNPSLHSEYTDGKLFLGREE